LAQSRLNDWRGLFARAMRIVDSVAATGERFDDWSFGGGTVLMRRFRHRVSKDVDIFVPDPQYLGYVSPRLNDTAADLTPSYLETAISVKLYFPEGEIDFIVSPPLTRDPTTLETVLGRRVRVDTTAEIIAKKVWHRGADFTARDMFDLALVAEREPTAIEQVAGILRERRDAIRSRIASGEKALRKTYAELDMLDFRPSFDECRKAIAELLDRSWNP
jgi:predicted nucleotidyltransferase component of viral defense system